MWIGRREVIGAAMVPTTSPPLSGDLRLVSPTLDLAAGLELVQVRTDNQVIIA
jgi:hypothetical protein